MKIALKLYDAGFNVVPVGADKRPLCEWGSRKRIPRERLEQLLDKARGIAVVGGPENPWKPTAALVIVDVDDPRALDKSPALRSVIESTVAWRTGPRCPKCGEKHVEVLEPGSRFKCSKCSTEFTLEEALRGIGALITVDNDTAEKYFRGTVRAGNVEFLVNNYALIPPSTHPTGVKYEWIKPFNFEAPDLGVRALVESEVESLLEELGILRREVEEKEVAKPPVKLRELADSEIIKVKELLKPAYKPGARQHIWLFLSGWAAKAGISPISVARILKMLYEETGDADPVKTRAAALVCSYRKAGIDLTPYASGLEELFGVKPYGLENEISEEEVKGKSGLQEILESALKETLGSGEVALGVIKEVEDIFRTPLSVRLSEKLQVSRSLVKKILKARKKGRITDKMAKISSLLADAVLEYFKHVKNFTIKDADLGLHCWEGKRYEPCKGDIETWIERAYKLLRLENHGVRYSIIRNEVIEILKARTREALIHEPAVLAFENCVFDWDALECGPHDPSVLIFHYIPHEIDVAVLREGFAKGLTEDFVAKHAPKTLKAFKEWAGDKWILLFELVGFVLYPRPYKKLVLLMDREGASGDTGKSTYIRYLQNVVGKENYCSIPLQVLTDPHQKFTASIIYRKLANFYADLPEKALEDVGQLKVLTGEDTITIEFKYGNPFTWLPYTKHVFSANVPPVVRKYDAAFWGRWLVIEFLGNFKVKVREFEKTLEDEIPQAIALGIAAFVNVLRRGRFSYENTAEDAKIIWMSRSDTVYAFMEWAKAGGALFETPSGRTPIDNLYPYYVSYCELSDKEALEQKDFTSRLKNLGYTVKRPKNVPILLGYDMNAEKMEALIKKSKEEE
jgi:phage/plasmid-associated DNA primase/DNA-directed RNA polymerase subunit RPC12/RpoP